MDYRFPGIAFLALLSVSSLQAGESARTARFEVETHEDITYYDGKDAHPVKHKLDLYLPRGERDFPVLFFVHGGAWQHGDKGMFGFYRGMGKSFASAGIGTVVINYRLSPLVQHPGHIEDVARAFAWTYKNIGRYGGRRDQIFVCGHSAGGHLVALLTTSPRYLKEHGLSPRVIRGVIPISGVYLIPDGLLGRVFGNEPAARKEASPIHHVRADLPPFLICYADKDFPGCGKETSEAFAQALRARGNEVKTREFTNSSHILIITSAALAGEPVFEAIQGFITTLVAVQP